MDPQIKSLVEATAHARLKKLIENHVKELLLQKGHLVIFVDNAAPLHEMNDKAMDEHLRKSLEKVFDPGITYEIRLFHAAQANPDHVRSLQPRRQTH